MKCVAHSYRNFLGECVTETVIQQRAEIASDFLNDCMDASEVFDMAQQTETSQQGKFDRFWEAVDHLLKGGDSVPNERRHGTVNYVAPTFVSLRDLHERAIDKMKELYPESDENNIPSQEYLR